MKTFISKIYLIWFPIFMIIPFVFPGIHDTNSYYSNVNAKEGLHLICKFIAIITAIIQFIVNKIRQSSENESAEPSYFIEKSSLLPAVMRLLYIIVAVFFFAYTNVTFINDRVAPDIISSILSYPFISILSMLPVVISPSYIWSLSYVVIGFFGTYILIDSVYYFFAYMMQKVEYQH